jgi:guanylate kinase
VNNSPARLVVISAPSGTGKSTVCRRLIASCEDVAVSISYTTRTPRGRERDGKEYHFVDDATFDRMIAEDAFLEWAEVHGRRYGSGHADVQRLLDEGKDVLFDIDVQGGKQIKSRVRDALLIFLLPPSIEELVRRLRGRGTESEKQLATRMRNAEWELKQGSDYDYHVVNDDLEEATAEVNRIRHGHAPVPGKQSELLRKLLQNTSGHSTGKD